MEFSDFAVQIRVVGDKFRGALQELNDNPPQGEVQLPEDLHGLLASVRSVADDLILRADVDEAIALLKQDPARAATLGIFVGYADVNLQASALVRAYEATHYEPTALPLHAYCSYLIELCNVIEQTKRGD